MKPHSLFFTLIALLLLVQSVVAEDIRVQYRLIGLFQPDRVDDLRQQAGLLPANDPSGPAEVKLVEVNYETATATFSYDSESQHLRNRKPEQVRERINHLLRTASHNTFSLSPPSEVKSDQLREERIGVAGLDCKGCAYGAYRSIANLDGVDRAVVSFRDGHVTVWIDPLKTDRDALVAALQKARVEVTEP